MPSERTRKTKPRHKFKKGHGYVLRWLDAVSNDTLPEPPYGCVCRPLVWYIDTDNQGTHLFASEGGDGIGNSEDIEPSDHRFFIAIPDAMILNFRELDTTIGGPNAS